MERRMLVADVVAQGSVCSVRIVAVGSAEDADVEVAAGLGVHQL